MNIRLIASITFISLALLFYSLSIWSSRRAKEIKTKHVVLSWLGLFCDATGTVLMTILAGAWTWNLHGITGSLAIILMLVNAIWVTLAFTKKDESLTANYLKFSIVVWFIWLIPFFGGMAIAMQR